LLQSAKVLPAISGERAEPTEIMAQMSLSSGTGKKAAMAIYCDAEQNNSHDDCLRPNTSPFKRQSGNGAPALFNAWSTSTHQKQRRRAVATRTIRVPNNTRSTSQSSHTRTQQYFALWVPRAPWPDGRVFHSAHNHRRLARL